MLAMTSKNWWLIALRGAAAILFGFLAFFVPGLTLAAVIILFGVYALMDGVLAIVLAVRGARAGERWGAMLVLGIFGVAAGIISLVWPVISALSLTLLIAAWAMVTGLLEIVAAIKLRKEIEGEWLLLLSGVLSVLLGALTALFPAVGILVFVWWLGAYVIAYGVVLLVLAFRVRSMPHAVPVTA